MSHKSAGADEYQSPSKKDWVMSEQNSSKVRVVRPKSEVTNLNLSSPSDEILVVVSKLKAYVKERSGLNTSADVMPELSNIIRKECDNSIERAKQSERKTLMARDF